MSSFKRTPYQTLAALLVLYFTLFLLGVIFLAMSFLYGLLSYVETSPQVTVYFQSEATEPEVFAIRDELKKSNKVSSIRYISKQEAFDIYKNETKDNPLLLEMTSATILPPSLEIFATKPEYLPEIAKFLETKEGVDEVQFQEIIVDQLLSLTQAVRNATLALSIFLFTMATVVIVATSSFKIALRKDEIEILQLIGASKYFIVKPFLSEGFWLGIMASILSFVTLLSVLFFVTPALKSYLSGIQNINLNVAGTMMLQVWPFNPLFIGLSLLLTTLFGVFIGMFANLMAARKYLS
jgi:cell division transport system permease protein